AEARSRLIESIGIGAEIEHADRKAKQAGSRFKDIFVVASRFRSAIAGVSAMLETRFGRSGQLMSVSWLAAFRAGEENSHSITGDENSPEPTEEVKTFDRERISFGRPIGEAVERRPAVAQRGEDLD